MTKYLFLILLSPFVMAISEQNYWPLFKNEVIPYVQANTIRGSFSSPVDGMKIAYGKLLAKDKKRHHQKVVLITGLGESFIKYAEVFYDLKDVAVDFYFMDHRSQGFSDKPLEDKDKGYIADFNHYSKDLIYFVEKLVKKSPEEEVIVLAHSMGGMIATLSLAQNPHLFKKGILIAPMYKIRADPYNYEVGKLIAKLLYSVGMGQSYTPGFGPYKKLPEFGIDKGASSKIRYDMKVWINKEYPVVAFGGPTISWLRQAYLANDMLNEQYNKIVVPLLIFSAGNDKVVDSTAHQYFCGRIKNCQLVELPTSMHEPLMEVDSIRDQVIARIKTELEADRQ